MSANVPSPPKPPTVAQRTSLMGWLARNAVVPLTPFLVGSAIRWIRAGQLNVSCFDPAELAFSLAMFCIVCVASARRLEDTDQRELAFALFVIGVAVFISMFSFSVVEASRRASQEHDALGAALTLLKNGAAVPGSELTALAAAHAGSDTNRILLTILSVVAVLGILYIVAGLVFRDRYGLGED